MLEGGKNSKTSQARGNFRGFKSTLHHFLQNGKQRMHQRKVWHMLYWSLTILSVHLLVACAASTGPTATFTTPSLEYDKYAAEWVLTGAKFAPKSFWSEVMTRTDTLVWLRGTFDDTRQKKNIQLYANYAGQGAGGLIVTSASDSPGTPLETHRLENTFVQQTMLGAAYYPKELIAVKLPRDFLDAKRASGLDIRLNGYQNKSLPVMISAAYLADFLDRFDSAVAQPQPAK